MHWKTAMYLGIGVALGLALNNTIGGFANPLLANLKLSVAVNA
jgi:hypothetical protein